MIEFVPGLGLVYVEPPSSEKGEGPELKGKAYVPASRVTFNEPGVKSIAKRFVNTYFPEADHQRARDEVAASGGVKAVRHALEVREYCFQLSESSYFDVV